jgi:Structure-specific recognition protein (SSRP1)
VEKQADKSKDFERASKCFKIWYGVNLESREHALRGWNWGKAEFGKAELAFNVQNRPAFEIPYSEISNTNLAGKNEVAVEFNLGAEPTTNGANGHKEGSTRNRGRKAAAGRDELVEMRLYVPGTVAKKEKAEDAESGADEQEEDDAEETNAANLFYETLIDKAEIGEVAGDTYATFLDVLHLTPRSGIADLKLTAAAKLWAGDDSTSTCTKAHSDCEGKPTTIKSSTSPSRNSSSSPRTTRHTPSSPWAWIRRCDRVRLDTLLSSCN